MKFCREKYGVLGTHVYTQKMLPSDKWSGEVMMYNPDVVIHLSAA